MQHFPISNDVTETKDKAVLSTGPPLAPSVKHPTRDLTSSPDVEVVSSSPGLVHGRGLTPT